MPVGARSELFCCKIIYNLFKETGVTALMKKYWRYKLSTTFNHFFFIHLSLVTVYFNSKDSREGESKTIVNDFS